MKKDGSVHAGMEGFCREKDMIQVPLSVIAKWEQLECPNGEIYIVENPSVYAILCRHFKGQKACMCMNGQPWLSSLLTLDLLSRTGTTIYYAGDFDPEGILIAQKLRRYYEGTFLYWHMTDEDYRRSMSKEHIAQKRLQSLEKVTDSALADVVKTMQNCGLAGYQENIWKEYL